MGIRFYCPNGHRLHVKAFLAGKRGICPHCAVRFIIPLETEIPRSSPKLRPNSTAAGSQGAGLHSSSSPNGTVTLDAPKEAEPSQVDTGPAAKTIDPIDEAPDAIWYVRPPSGGQFGPAKGDVLRRWIAEGRVSADTMVWREGWSDWSLAGPVFSDLNAAYTGLTHTTQLPSVSPPISNGKNLPAASVMVESGSRGVPSRVAKKRKSLVPVIFLGLIVVALLTVLVIVLTRKL